MRLTALIAGATIQDTLISSIKICNYCGTKLNAAQGTANHTETLIGKANITVGGLSIVIAKWLNEPDYYRLPVNLKDVTIAHTDMAYYPAYVFNGRYKGEWNLKSNHKGGQLDGDFNVIAYACTLDAIIQSGDEDKALNMSLRSDSILGSTDRDVAPTEYLVNAVAKTSLRPEHVNVFNENEKTGAALYDFGMDEEAAWKMNGRGLLDDYVAVKIRMQLNSNSISDEEGYRKAYSVTDRRATKIYIPVWEVAFWYQDQKYYLALDAVSGNITGDEIVIENPEKEKPGWEQVLSAWFLIPLWLVWGIVRLSVPETSAIYSLNKKEHGFLLTSDSMLWYTRQGIILFIAFVVFPILRNMILKNA